MEDIKKLIVEYSGSSMKGDLNSHSPYSRNTNLSDLYKIATERGWDVYQFDIIKHVDNCNRTGQFLSDLEETKNLIDLYINEKTL